MGAERGLPIHAGTGLVGGDPRPGGAAGRMNRGSFVRPASRRILQHACHRTRANLQTDIPQQAPQHGLPDGCPVTECGNDGMGRGAQPTPGAGRQRCGEERVGAGDGPPLPHEADHLHVDAQALHDGIGCPMAHRIGGRVAGSTTQCSSCVTIRVALFSACPVACACGARPPRNDPQAAGWAAAWVV